MHIESLHLKNFRNYEQIMFQPGSGLNILVGLNAQGKSNFLEAITLLATTRSYRGSKENELIRFGEQHCALSTRVHREKANDVLLEVFLGVSEKKVARVNQVRHQRTSELLGHLNAVIFSAEDLDIVRGEPSHRRRFLNTEISQASPAYCHHLLNYRKGVEQRNRLLKEIQNRPSLAGTLQSWNALLAEHGSRLALKRGDFIKRINAAAREIHSQLTNGVENLEIEYHSSIPLEDSPTLEAIHAGYLQALAARSRDEILRGITLVGPHRDDLLFRINGADARIFSSQGQQRTAALSVKLAEVQLLREVTGESPVVLLDDVMSELDDRRRAQIYQFLADDCQAFITCTNLEALSLEVAERASVFNVRNGYVECAEAISPR